jgi:hypothetical protein
MKANTLLAALPILAWALASLPVAASTARRGVDPSIPEARVGHI